MGSEHGHSRRLATIVGATILAAAFAAPRAARADVTTTYDARKCLADTRPHDGLMSRPTGKIVNATPSGDVPVVCPIVKRTSAAGVTTDRFLSATIPVETSGSPVACEINVWRASVSNQGNLNSVKFWPGSRTSTGDIILASTTMAPGPTQFWNAGGTGNSWFYMDLRCNLPHGAALKNYTITEQGTLRPGSRLYPPSSCVTDPSNNIDWQTRSEHTQVGGLILGQATSGATKFLMDCPFETGATEANNLTVEMALGPPIATGTRIGCNFDNTNLNTLFWSVPKHDTGFPTVIPRPIDYHVIAVPLTGAGHMLDCGVPNAASGDGRLFGYRTLPQPSRSAWAVFSSLGSGAANAIDNNPATRWSSGTNGASGQWFKVDLGASRTVQQVTFDSGTSSNDFARGYQILGSTDGTTWTTIFTGTGTGPFISARFSEQFIRHVQIKLTSGFGFWWSIHELNVY